MRILNICKFDYAGYNWDLTRALKRHTHHEVRHVAMSEHEWRFGSDIVTANAKEIRGWIQWADVINCLGGFRPLDSIGAPRPFNFGNLLMTSVGDEYPYQIEKYRRMCEERGVKKRLHASILYSQLADAWIPFAMPVDEYRFWKKARSIKPVICQTPSNQRRKCTQEVIGLLGQRNDIELLIVNETTHRQCLKAKTSADIVIGHFPGKKIGDYISLGGCGKSSLEAWSMKIPVIAYAAEPRRSAYLETVGYLPYYESILENLPDAIDMLLSVDSLYNEYSERGYQYVKTFHDDPVVARRFINVCQEILAD